MKAHDLHKKKNKNLMFCILISVVCPLGIPLIPIGFTHGGPAWLAAAIAGIVLTAFGFYGIPMFWLGFAGLNRKTRVFDAIDADALYSVEEIATQTALAPKLVRKDVEWLVGKRYLQGFLFDGETISINRNRKLKPLYENKSSCPGCGSFETVKKEDGYYCAYCGTKLYSIG